MSNNIPRHFSPEMLVILDRLDRNNKALITLIESISNTQGIQQKTMLEFMEDMRAYREAREKRETLSTTEKIEAAIKKNSFMPWFVDKVLPYIVLAAIMAILKLI